MTFASAPLLSICMIVKNEEAVLGRALASAAMLDAELVVVDTGSSDRTVAIAEAAGAVVHHFTWVDDFSAARNFAFSCATGTWMLVLDADEVLGEGFCARVAEVLKTTTGTALSIPVTCVDDRGKSQGTMMSTRILRNGLGYVYEGRVHEDVTPSVLRAGGTLASSADLPLLHHGYTSAESARKDRQARNIALLEAAHRAAPDDPRYWHYLAAEHRMKGDLASAAAWFDRVLARAPDHELAAWSASNLAAIHEAELDFGTAWQVGALGFRGNVGRVSCLVQVGQLALHEGDGDSARWCADEIERTPGDDLTDRATSLERAAELRAGALLEKAVTPKTRGLLLDAVKRYPRNSLLAELLVKACEAVEGRGLGANDALRRSGQTSTVVAAVMKATFANGGTRSCVELGRKSGVRNEAWAFAVARSGNIEEAREELLAFGERAAAHAIVFGIAYADEAAIAYALGASPAPYAEAFAHVRAGTKVPSYLAWIITAWLRMALALREPNAATTLTNCLPWSATEREAFRALCTYDAGEPTAALTRALDNPKELASFEVIGLVAHAHGDFAAAATMLSMRALAGDAPVRVYLKGADALARVGRAAQAEALLAKGRLARPHSRALAAAAPFAAPRAVHPRG